MFSKKIHADVKKSTQKIQDPKKDTATRLRHIKIIIDNADIEEARHIFEANFSHIYFVLYESFINAEATLKQRELPFHLVHKAHREEVDCALAMLERVFVLLPELIGRRWQCHSLTRIMYKLLHPGNSWKLRRDATRLFLLWYQALGERAPDSLHNMFASLVPGFPQYSMETLNPSMYATGTSDATRGCPVSVVEIHPLLPPQSGEKQPDDLTRFFLDLILEYMVSEITKIEWEDKAKQQPKCFSFLLERFKQYYLPHIFPKFSHTTSLYKPTLDLPELRQASQGRVDGKRRQDPLVPCRVALVKWVANYTHVVKREAPLHSNSHSARSITPGEDTDHSPDTELRRVSVSQVGSGVAVGNAHEGNSSSSTDGASKLGNRLFVDGHIQAPGMEDPSTIGARIVRDVLYGSRKNVNFVHEVYRQAFLLNFTHSPAIRRAIAVYKDWIQMNVAEVPPFMLEPPPGHKEDQSISSSEGSAEDHKENARVLHSKGDYKQENLSVYAGSQCVLQVFVTHAANVFLLEVSPDYPLLLEEQVDTCKRVLNIYRYMVMHTRMESATWEQLLLVLLQITSLILSKSPPSRKEETLGGKLAPAIFQTLIVTWIKANLNVVISADLWDRFLHVLSSLNQWEELVREWAKTLETLTRVLARHVYGLDLTDLPLDRLSEQKAKKKRGGDGSSRWAGGAEGSNNSSSSARQRRRRSSVEATSSPASSSIPVQSLSSVRRTEEEGTIPEDVFPDGSPPSLTQESSRRRSGSGSGILTLNQLGQSEGVGGGSPHLQHPTRYSHSGAAISHSSVRPRSASEGDLSSLRSNSSSSRSRPSPSTLTTVPVLPSSVEREVERILACPQSASNQIPNAQLLKSHSLDSLLGPRAGTPLRFCESEGPTRSPSPSPSSGIESNSIKDSPMQIDVVGADATSTDLPDGSCSSALAGGVISSSGGEPGRISVMSGGTVRGWLPDVAVVLWRRMLGALGDVNALKDPVLHARVFDHFVELCETLVKIRLNQGVSGDNQTTPPPPELVPPIGIVAPWCFEALKLPDTHKKGKLCAYRLLCNITVTPQDIPPPRDYLIEFYRVLHKGLTCDDQAVINTLIRFCGPRFFSTALPGSSILLLDFIHAAREVASSSDIKGAPRTEACSILGGLLCYCDAVADAAVLRPEHGQFTMTLSTGAKDLVLDALLQCGRCEPTGIARCIALSGLGIFLQGELTSSPSMDSHFHGPHPRVKEATNVLLLALGFNCNMVGQVASDILFMLCDHADKLMESFPDIPPRILEVLVLTLEHLSNSCGAGVVEEEHRRLMTSLLFCMGEWCMRLPLSCFLAPQPSKSFLPKTGDASQGGSSLLRIIFEVLDAIVAGDVEMKRVEGEDGWAGVKKRGRWPAGIFEDSEIDAFYPDLILDNLRVGGMGSPPGTPAKKFASSTPPINTPDSGGSSPSSNGVGNRVKLAARMVRAHLVNHIGHFPMSADGAAWLPSLVVEHDDVPGLPADELSAQVFSAPNVQLFVMSGTYQLMSLVELETLGQARADDLVPGSSEVRVLLRGIGGKACWDVSILHCANSDSPYFDEDSSQKDVPWADVSESKDLNISLDGGDMSIVVGGKFQTPTRRPISIADESQQSLLSIPSSRLHSLARLSGTPPQHTMRHRPPDLLPTWNNAAEDMDNLDDLLQYIGHTSPECLDVLDGALNVPAPPPPQLVPGAQEDAISALLGQRHTEREHLLSQSTLRIDEEEFSSMTQSCLSRPTPPKSLAPFQHARLLFSRLGLAGWERRPHLHLLNKGEKLLRELRNLDSQRCRETHKIAVIYVADGQEDKNSILSNTSGSQAYEEFIAGLAWEVELESHTGFLGGLQRNRSTGDTAPYYATSFLECMFHVATRMPSSSQESLLQKMRHLGNDEVHIVWSEHVRDYRRGILPTEFCDVLIVIYPLPNGLFRIHVSRKKEVPHFGPLFNEAIVDHKVLPGLVRTTALSASRAKRSMLPYYQNYYEERAKALETVVQNHKESTTFEDFIAQVYAPVIGSSPFGQGSIRSSGPDGIRVWFGGSGGGNTSSSSGNAESTSTATTAGVSPRPLKRPTFKSGGAIHQRKSFSVRSESVPVTPPDSPTPRKLK